MRPASRPSPSAGAPWCSSARPGPGATRCRPLIQGQRSQVLEIAVALFIGIEVVATLCGLLR
jgi:hypothetical protein